MRLLAATGDGVCVLEDRDGTWEARLRLPGSGIQCLAADPAHRPIVFAGSAGQGLFRSADAGETWQRLDSPAASVFSVAVSAADGAVYAGCEPSSIFKSGDGGATWRELPALRELPSAPSWSFPPRPWTSHVRWIAPSPHDPGVLLAGIELGGVMYSGDGGESWADHRPGAQRDVHALAWHPNVPGRAYEAGGGGAAWSRDGGRSWEPADEGRDRHYTWALAVDPADPERWYVSASPGPRQAHSPGRADAFVYRWQGEGPWERLAGGLPQPLESMVYALAFAAGRLVAGLADGRVYSSSDGGDRWQLVAPAGSRPERITALAPVEEGP